MEVFNQLSSPVMYLICGGIILFVAVICVVFAVRAWRAGKAIGMDTAVLRRGVTSSASISILPAVGILLGVIAAKQKRRILYLPITFGQRAGGQTRLLQQCSHPAVKVGAGSAKMLLDCHEITSFSR